MNTLETLIAARALLADPAHYTQEYYAEDDLGLPVEPTDPQAVCWCATGAILKVRGALIAKWRTIDPVYLALCTTAGQLTVPPHRSIIAVNDGDARIPGLEPHAAVLACFDRAIETLTKS